MKYENPKLEVIEFKKSDVVHTSLQTEVGGDGDAYEGDWSN